MRQFIAGLLVGSTLLGSAWAAAGLFTIEPFSAELTDTEVIACIKDSGEGAVLYNLTEDGAGSYTAAVKGYACVKAAK